MGHGIVDGRKEWDALEVMVMEFIDADGETKSWKCGMNMRHGSHGNFDGGEFERALYFPPLS